MIEGETIECEYCGKITTVTEGTSWVAICYIGCDEEETINLFCSDECLEQWARLTRGERANAIATNDQNEELAKEMKTSKKKWIKEC